MDKHREQKSKSESEYSSEDKSDDEKEVKQEEESAEHKSRSCVDVASYNSEKLKSYRKRKHDRNPQAQSSSSSQPCTVPILNFPKIQKLEITEKKITGKYPNYDKFSKELETLDASSAVAINDCFIEALEDGFIPLTYKFKQITFKNCNDNVYKVFRNLTALNGIIVHIDNFNGFPFKVTTLEAITITFGWYVGLKPARTNLLHAQKDSLKELRIHALPYDFDGGEVLKFILNEMNLETFYYGITPLILDGERQKIKEFAATEIQITSAIEMLNKFPSIEKFMLKICSSDISSDHIEEVLKSSASVFKKLTELVVIDNTSGSLGVFIDIFMNLDSLKKLTMTTNNRFIYAILDSLPDMPKLEEIHVFSTVADESKIREVIMKHAPNIKIINVQKSCTIESNQGCGGGSDFNRPDMRNVPSCSNFQRAGDGDEPPERGFGGNDDDGKKDEATEEPPQQDTEPTYPIVTDKDREFSIRSSFDPNIDESLKFYIHACGHAECTLDHKNLNELIELIAEFSNYIIHFDIEAGKILVKFRGTDGTPNPHQNDFKAKLKKLAYQINKQHQLPLIILIFNRPVSFRIDINIKWNYFLMAVKRDNAWLHGASRWDANGSPADGPFTINVDPLSYYQIKNRGNQLTIKGIPYDIVDIENPYEPDASEFRRIYPGK